MWFQVLAEHMPCSVNQTSWLVHHFDNHSESHPFSVDKVFRLWWTVELIGFFFFFIKRSNERRNV